jgi:hypothetical protein
MNKWLILAFLLIAASAYGSFITLKDFENPLSCADCHANEYKNYLLPINNSELPVHKNNKITCIDCHSSPGFQSDLEIKKLILKKHLVNYSLPAINTIFQVNSTLNETLDASELALLKPDCIKCHDVRKIETRAPDHTIVPNCMNCHTFHKEPSKNTGTGFWKLMGEGGHRNLTCGACHGDDVMQLGKLPQCTKCHSPHLNGAQWDRSVCLGCHSDPHIPVRNSVFNDTPPKEACGACHNSVYQTLTIYDSKHNWLPSCASCHPKHREKMECMTCHTNNRHDKFHPGAKCVSCHGLVTRCTGCHTDPHAPLKNVPIISGQQQWEEYATMAGKKKPAG